MFQRIALFKFGLYELFHFSDNLLYPFPPDQNHNIPFQNWLLSFPIQGSWEIKVLGAQQQLEW